MPTDSLLQINNLTISFPSDGKQNTVIHDISFEIKKNEILGIVGESGSGKSVSSLAILGLLPKKTPISGTIYFEDKDLLIASEKQFRKIRGAKISMIFQEPMSSLNPSLT
jgi:peptide/nickel transport system ATP-binding protein